MKIHRLVDHMLWYTATFQLQPHRASNASTTASSNVHQPPPDNNLATTLEQRVFITAPSNISGTSTPPRGVTYNGDPASDAPPAARRRLQSISSFNIGLLSNHSRQRHENRQATAQSLSQQHPTRALDFIVCIATCDS